MRFVAFGARVYAIKELTPVVARREYGERIHSRMFYASTLFLAAFAILVAFAPLFFKALDQTTTTRVAVVAA